MTHPANRDVKDVAMAKSWMKGEVGMVRQRWSISAWYTASMQTVDALLILDSTDAPGSEV